jgi:membrane fusion protein (multidrug efflux system)
MNKTSADAAYVPAETTKTTSRITPRQLALGAVAIVALVVGGFYGIKKWQFALVHEDTDDAQVEGDISPVLPRVSGYVSRVLVVDNQHVNAGQALMEIDSRELDLKVASAEAALQSALADKVTSEAILAGAHAMAATAGANVETALVRQRKAAEDLVRDSSLQKTGAITESQFNDTRAAADTTAAQLAGVKSEAQTAEAQISVAVAKVSASQTKAAEKASDLDYARLQRSYSSVPAPIAGIVSRKNVEPGQYVQTGQTLLSIASDSDVWIVANFKETQITSMRPGQDVDIEPDSYPGYLFHGKIESISGATGARFALLPPDNSTGNYVKVTQRLPVKIVLTQAPDADHPLRPGMSVTATVRVK